MSLAINRESPPREIIHLAAQLEALLVACNLRGMAGVRSCWQEGYLLRAVQVLLRHQQRVSIVSGFPVGQTYETDGPAGALALARGLRRLGAEVRLLGLTDYIAALQQCAPDLAPDTFEPFDPVGTGLFARQSRAHLECFNPSLLVFVEVPGRGQDDTYKNMRFADISARTLPWEEMLYLSRCPSLAFADGGNELGMGLVRAQLQGIPVAGAVAATDELVISDVSNWGVYGALGLASAMTGVTTLRDFDLEYCLERLNAAGIVDGVTGERTPTEDGLPSRSSMSMLQAIVSLVEPFLPSRTIAKPDLKGTRAATRTGTY